MSSIKTGTAARRAARDNEITSPTSTLAPGYAQANLLILPSQYATDFRLLCQRNPVALPLLAESPKPGIYDAIKSRVPWLEDDELLAHGCDLRKDAPKYDVYRDGELLKEAVPDVVEEWTDDHVAFLIGSSSCIESALSRTGFPSRYAVTPRYKTTKPLHPNGIFYDAHHIVSMHSCPPSQISALRSATAPYALTHGEPLDWGWGAVSRLGIRDLDSPDYGEKPLTRDGRSFGEVAWKDEEVPVFWGSGRSGVEAVVGMSQVVLEGVVMGSKVGWNLVVDGREGDLMRAF